MNLPSRHVRPLLQCRGPLSTRLPLALAAAAPSLGLGLGRDLHTSTARRHILKSRYPDLELPEKNYFDFIWTNQDKNGDRIALVNGVTDEKLTYAESYRRSKNFGLALQEAGARPKDVLAMFLPNCLEYPLILAGAASVGVAVTTVNPSYTATELAKQLMVSKASWAVTRKESLPTLMEAIRQLPDQNEKHWKNRILILGDELPEHRSATKMLMTDIPGHSDVVVDVRQDTCVLPFSSGTTGVPKGVELTHFNLVANACQCVDSVPEMRVGQYATDSFQPVSVCVLPMFHIGGMNLILTISLHTGGTLVVMPYFEPKAFIRMLNTYQLTSLPSAPPLASFIASHPEVTLAQLEKIPNILVAAAPSGPALVNKFRQRWPHMLYREGWGMTETSPLCTLAPSDDIVLNSCGVLLPNTEAKVVDTSTGVMKGPNELGELCVRGPQVMKGYLNNPEATAKTIKEDGWLHSGDIAKYDENGRFFVVDRLKELIKVKGFQVPPAELDDLLRSHNKVQDVSVIGIPHEKFGEAPRAYIVPKPDSSLSEEEVHAYMSKNAAPYKQLIGGVEFIDAVPKTAAGKILRKDLVAKWKSENGV